MLRFKFIGWFGFKGGYRRWKHNTTLAEFWAEKASDIQSVQSIEKSSAGTLADNLWSRINGIRGCAFGFRTQKLRRVRNSERRLCGVDVLEKRQLLSQDSFVIPANVADTFTALTANGQRAAAEFESRANILLEKAGLHSPYEMATEIRSTNSKFLQVANMTPQGNNIPPGTFGTAIRNLFNQDSSQFASQVESLVSDFSTNSTKKPATLPTSFDSGTVLTFPGMPWMSYSTPFYVLGADGWASVTPTSVSAVAKKEQTNSNAAPGWIDTFKQTASWYDTTTTNGFFEFDIAKNRTSPDGLTSLTYDIKFRETEGSPLHVEGVFHQRDGAWIRDVSFKADGDNFSLGDATLKYENGGTVVGARYHVHGEGGIDPKRIWTGEFSTARDVFDQPMKFVGGSQYVNDGTLSAFATAGLKLDQSWLVVGLGHQDRDGAQTQNIGQVAFYLQQDLGPLGGIGTTLSYAGNGGPRRDDS